MSTEAIRYQSEAPHLFELLFGVEQELAASGIEAQLRHLVKLRASQINQCAHCVKMHTAEARRDGETDDRLDRLVVWAHVSDFSAAEKAALAWTEALTVVDARTDYATLRAGLREHFSVAEITALTGAIAMINLWNRIQISGY